MADYLRNRPFLTVSFIERAAPGVSTRTKGWRDEPGAIQTFEKVSFLDRINSIHNYGVIIDVINSAVIRNTTKLNESEIMASYLGKYKAEVTQSLTIWAQREARDLVAKEGLEALLAEGAKHETPVALQEVSED